MRFIQFGYKMENGCLVVDDIESKYVKEMFELYNKSSSLNSICEYLNNKQVKYDGENIGWNKRRIDRILSNNNYIGFNNYPQIIDTKLFDSVQVIKNSKKFIKKPISYESSILKDFVYCGQCKTKMYRVPKWDTREKWICNNGCKCEKYFDDKEILKSIKKILLTIKNNNDILKLENDCCQYNRTSEIIKYNNEIGNELNREELNYEIIKRLIMESVNAKFKACSLDRHKVYTLELLKRINEIDIENIEVKELYNIVSKIFINTDGLIEVELLNGDIIKEEKDGNDSKSSNKNRCKSNTCE